MNGKVSKGPCEECGHPGESNDSPVPKFSLEAGCNCNTACPRCSNCGRATCHKKAHIYSGVDFSDLDELDFTGQDPETAKGKLQHRYPRAHIDVVTEGNVPPGIKIVTSRRLIVSVGKDGLVSGVKPVG
mmetsp:Transcript_29951/g.41813  ORF Transcript_29951/g.41813 Transcript_29951/m.41813 type:complete len:129 (-) Transcript_29951:422-808(-)|eukprot:CAMPEP_0175088134 /NCGR_PEP_ID=MMETSP0086_2-20121207/91_1 /TAXON_ID=136419 /ORGANISM="Unknown Unknown, Strain D1" /LENGTH=128 /DNA_ID=CAMNT_0016360557 /DNA_START=21 /DNA_END=407 /DNA_ORIENTATION=-